MSSGSLGGGSFAAKGAEKLMDKKVGKDTCCPSLSFRMRLIGFGVCFILGKSPFLSFNTNRRLYGADCSRFADGST
jgi:hypothetical protein